MLKFIVFCVFVTISTVHSNPLTPTESKVTATVAPLVTGNEDHKKTAEGVAVADAVPEIKPADTIFNEKLVEGVVVDEVQPEVKPVRSSRQSRQRVTSLQDALQCGFDVACFLDVIEVVMDERKQIMLADADARYITSNVARKTSNESPSELADTVEGIISKMTDIVKETVTGWFADEKDDGNTSKETETSEEDIENEEANNNEEHKEVSEESRGKKKKKLKSLMKLLILGAVLKAKLTVLLQLLSAALQVKFFFIALTGLLINKIRLWYDLKKGHHPQKVIYYEHAQHQHHYDHLEDDHHGGGGFWGRAYEVPEEGSEEHAQDLAYRGQKSRRPIPWSPPQRGGYEHHYE